VHKPVITSVINDQNFEVALASPGFGANGALTEAPRLSRRSRRLGEKWGGGIASPANYRSRV